MQSDKLPKVTTQLTTEAEISLNNRLSGFVYGGLHQWQRAIRQHGSSTSAQYRTLTSARNHLMSSIEAVPSKASVLVYNPVVYARIHNEGGDTVPPHGYHQDVKVFFCTILQSWRQERRERS